MTSIIESRSEKVGKPPGVLIPIGDFEKTPPEITKIAFNVSSCEIEEVSSINNIKGEIGVENMFQWVDVRGLNDIEVIESIGEAFGIYRLWLEDVLNTDHRPKLDFLQDQLFIVLKAIDKKSGDSELEQFEQISIFLGQNYVLTFQEKKEDSLSVIKNRLQNNRGRVRREGVEYLFYAIIDSVVDQYYVALTDISRTLDELEENLESITGNELISGIRALRYRVLKLKRVFEPARESMSALLAVESQIHRKNLHVYLQDVYQHTVHISDSVRQAEEVLKYLQDTHLALSNQKLNETMKILTIFAAIFIPLTLIAGIYGMNFENMPEIKWKWGYPASLLVMVLTALGLLFYFKKKKWI